MKQLNKGCNQIKEISIAVFFTLTILSGTGCTPSSANPYAYISSAPSPISKQEIDEKLAAIAAPDAAKAASISGVNTSIKSLALSFDGLNDKNIDKILDCLDENGIKATFFLPGSRVAVEPDIASKIVKRGHSAENYTLSAKSLVGLNPEQLYTEIARTNLIIKEKTGSAPRYLRTADTTPSDEVLKTASACGLTAFVGYDVDIFSDSKPVDELVRYFLNHISRGDVLRFNTNANEKDLELFSQLLKALCAEGFEFVSVDELQQRNDLETAADVNAPNPNLAKKSEIFSYAYTTRKAVALTFNGLGGNEMVSDILNALDQSKIKATFFLSGYAVSDNIDLVKEILDRGHEIENATLSFTDMTKLDYNQAYAEIKSADEILKNKLGIAPKYLRPRTGTESEAALSAAAALGYTMVGYSKNPQDGDMKSAQEIEAYIRKRITRGEIILLNADKNPEVIKAIPLIASYVYNIGYRFVTVDELYNNQYERKPVEKIPGYRAPRINLSATSLTKDIYEQLPTVEKTVAITFDDWGSDKNITAILNILSAKGIKASFFLRGNGVIDNPNLAKAIAEEGHDVANHTFSHKAVTTYTPKELQEDIIKGHQTLAYAIQRQPDMLFRPPTFEIDEKAAITIEACGYENIIRSDVSPQDWNAENSPAEVLEFVNTHVTNGSIITLHLQDNSSAAAVLAKMIDNLRANGYSFAKVSEYIR